jgi:hypothetical protein
MSRLRPQMPWFRLAPCGNGAGIADCGIGTDKLADCSVTSIKIADSAVGNAEIADCSIGSSKIQDCGIATGDIADSAVTTGKILDSAVTYAKIQNVSAGARLLGRYDAVSGIIQEIALGANLSFDSDAGTIIASGVALADCGVTNIKLADCAVYGVKIADCSIDSSKLADSAVTSDGIADSSVTTAKIPDCGITYAKIQNVTAQRLLGREDAVAGSPQEIALTAPLQFDTNSDAVEIADCGITSAFIADCSVTSVKIADSGVATGDIADCAVTSAKIADSNVTANEIADSAIITAKMSDCAVTNAKLGDSAVSGVKLADSSITAAKMSDSTLHTRVIEIHMTDTTISVGDTAATFFVPAELNGYDLVRAEAAVKVYSTSGRPTFQLRDVADTLDMMVNKITIDSGEKTSFTSDTASSIDTTNDTLTTGQEIAIDIDSAGTGVEDVYIILSVRKP